MSGTDVLTSATSESGVCPRMAASLPSGGENCWAMIASVHDGQ